MAEKRADAATPVGYASQNGGVTGGAGGTTTTVSTLPQITEALQKKDDSKKVVYVKGKITGSEKIYVGSNKSILGVDSDSGLEGVGLLVRDAKNVIIRNLAISKVEADNGDAISIDGSTNVWVDHCDLSSDLSADKDFYDGLLDISHGADYVTVSNVYFHDHHKNSLVGHSDSNADEDTGKLHVTYYNNYWSNVGSRCPLVRFGTVHVVNNYYENVSVSGINTRMGAQVLVENNVFNSVEQALVSVDSKEDGYAVARGNDWGTSTNEAPEGTLTEVPYEYTAVDASEVKAAVVGKAGNTLSGL
ncbi:polysaccharide lyase family 1 protein [Aplosporella prunicola CBS 121167]|uniref:pectate lyase n=1 Tax=Aplosporella prunicola CBS 121167 TaxID=1176127 RepID=A0A6A6B0H8_9PEZI|nr:polysaccharide lyase family 1 protein [Aplosporella prunicola CBS 121167]KAF2137386.1 polysaccharide lyase family 1 protein [Aplosporella prunicola CBS 121167]